jgi:uncharacterized protein (TIGR00730 family)
MPKLCVYAASSRHLPAHYYDIAQALGEAAGRSGWDLVFGGANIGLMNSVALGFQSTGAKILSVIPHLFDKRGLTFSASDEVLLTEDLRHRKRIMEAHADAFLALPGGPGTLDEFYETLTLKQLRLHAKPMVLFNLEGHFDGTVAQIRRMVERGFADADLVDQFVVTDSIAAALAVLAAPSA